MVGLLRSLESQAERETLVVSRPCLRRLLELRHDPVPCHVGAMRTHTRSGPATAHVQLVLGLIRPQSKLFGEFVMRHHRREWGVHVFCEQLRASVSAR